MSPTAKMCAVVLCAGLSPAIPAKDLVDQCVGGKWDELVAQAAIVMSRKYPEYGLSEKTAFECPSFSLAVVDADSLNAAEKRFVFANFMEWPEYERASFYATILKEVRKAYRSYMDSGGLPKANRPR